MSPRFDAATYPGPRPAGPVLLHQGQLWPLDVTGPALLAPDPVAGAPVLQGPVRWSVAYGSNASPDRLRDKGLDVNGALLLPARLRGWRTVWEARRAATGAVPLTLVPAPGSILDTWVLGIHPADTGPLDATEGRGTRYRLGRVGPVAVAARWWLADAVAYGPGSATRCLTRGTELAGYPEVDHAGAGVLLDGGSVALAVDPLPGTVEGDWPASDLEDLPLFVYGTLQPGRSRWEAIEALVEVVGEASASGAVTGTYYGYPAADFAGAGTVHGTLLRATGPAAAEVLYRQVDAIEDVPDLFRRVAVPVRVGAEAIWAASYAWNDARGAPPGQPVPDGRWT